MTAACRSLEQLLAQLPKDQLDASRALIDAQLGHYMDHAPFLQRARAKPLGYAGDYELMNMIARGRREGASLFGRALHTFATQQPSAQANLNRIGYFASKIAAAAAATPFARARIVGVGPGPAKEVERLLTQRPDLGARVEVALFDHEAGAVAHCERALGPIAARTGARLRVFHESARTLLTHPRLSDVVGDCDLIYSPGLFDYLSDRSFAALLAALYGLLRDGGQLVVGHVAKGSPDRYVLEYLADWPLRYRSEDELAAFAAQLAPAPRRVDVEREASGVNLFLVIAR
jgi:extracellular factor (EF) 3-hydroxypalmitic acid methyl ester biosynthesis protein